MIPIFSRLEIHPKKWGEERWIINNDKYCGKILVFRKDCEFSTHFHAKKTETWLVTKGCFIMTYIDTNTAARKEKILYEGDVIHISPCVPHRLKAISDGLIFEVSTQHFEDDSYRVEKGDSQK